MRKSGLLVLILSAKLLAQVNAYPPTASAVPSGAAGGDLAGTYPNPTIDLTLAKAWTAIHTFRANAIAATPTERIRLQNQTAATAGVPSQWSPCIYWEGQGWKTDATAASQKVEFRQCLVPVEGAAAPQARLDFGYSLNGGAFVVPVKFLNSALEILDTVDSTTGVIYKGADRFIHNFHHPTGGGAVPAGLNTFVGIGAGNFTMGSTATVEYQSSFNSAMGANSLLNNTTGFSNSAVGTNSLLNNTVGYYISAMGANSLQYNTIGHHNSVVGMSTGYKPSNDIARHRITNDSNMVLAGYGATKDNEAQLDNGISIGALTEVTESNQVVLGNTNIAKTLLRGIVGIGATATPDIGFSRNAAGVLEINSGTAGKWGGLKPGVISMQSLAVPGAPTVTPTCVSACTQTWTYGIVAKLADGTTTEIGATGSTAAQNATLDGTNFNVLTWSAVTGATSYDVRRTVSGGTPATLGLIATVTAATFTDDGDVGDASASPALNQTGMLKMNLATPTASANACTAGNLWFDASFIYACTASGVIKRVAIATW